MQTKVFSPTESELQKAIKEYLLWHGWFVFKIHQSLGSYKGIADLYAIKNGISVWIEVKTPAGQQSEHQKQFQEDIESHGGIYLIARSLEGLKKDLSLLELEQKSREKSASN